MNRRKFTRNIAAGALMFPTIPSTVADHRRRKKVKIIKPKALRAGDTIGLIAPSSGIKDGQLDRSIAQLQALGLKTVVGEYAEDKNGFLAGTDKQRVKDINAMFFNENIQGIWCIRGGYGLSRIVSDLHKKTITNNPKLLIGYSDVTCLNQYLACQGMVSIHGQVGGAEFTPAVADNLQKVCFGGLEGFTMGTLGCDDPYTIVKGKATGRLTGGNLSLLAALVGTPYLDSFKGKLVFIEDVGEPPYRVDRMLTQLIHGTDLRKACGIILGQWADCEKKEGSDSFSFREVLMDRLKPLNIPCCYGMSFGHVDQNLAMPLLIKATFDAGERTLTFLEEAVV